MAPRMHIADYSPAPQAQFWCQYFQKKKHQNNIQGKTYKKKTPIIIIIRGRKEFHVFWGSGFWCPPPIWGCRGLEFYFTDPACARAVGWSQDSLWVPCRCGGDERFRDTFQWAGPYKASFWGGPSLDISLGYFSFHIFPPWICATKYAKFFPAPAAQKKLDFLLVKALHIIPCFAPAGEGPNKISMFLKCGSSLTQLSD